MDFSTINATFNQKFGEAATYHGPGSPPVDGFELKVDPYSLSTTGKGCVIDDAHFAAKYARARGISEPARRLCTSRARDGRAGASPPYSIETGQAATGPIAAGNAVWRQRAPFSASIGVIKARRSCALYVARP